MKKIAIAAWFAAFALPFGLAEDKKDEFKLPPLDAKEWKKDDNGMKIWDVTEGKGEAVKAGAKVKVHYTGWLTDGTVFDSSKKKNEPFETSLNRVIEGWKVGVVGMKPGGVRRLLIPPELAYGKKGAGD